MEKLVAEEAAHMNVENQAGGGTVLLEGDNSAHVEVY